MQSEFIAQLGAHGYFRGASPEIAEAMKSGLLQRGWGAVFGESHRLFHADAEDLAEGGLSAFIASLVPFLSTLGVVVPPIEDLFSDTGYSLRTGNRTKLIYGATELRRESAGEPGLIWGLAAVRGFAFVNDLLESAGSPERLYAVNGGNDLFGFFLTPELLRIISDHPDATRSDCPYTLKAEYPAFGQQA